MHWSTFATSEFSHRFQFISQFTDIHFTLARRREALKVLEDSIAFASKILHIDTTNVEPLYHVHSEQYLQLRDDVETEGNIADQLLKNAPLTEEEYFVSPPGNVELDAEEKNF